MDKYCRICWNTLNWRAPSGDAAYIEQGDSYVAKHGFGHEEWIFNNEWLLSGYESGDPNHYRYGFLQPISKYRHKYIGLTFSVLLYAVNPDTIPMIVAHIDNLYVPDDREIAWALIETRGKGWLDSMQGQIRALGSSVEPLVDPDASSIANVRFLPEDVKFFDPMVIVDPPHKITKIHRYQPLNWDDGFQPVEAPVDRSASYELSQDDARADRSETERRRAAQAATTFDPQHARLQNRLRAALSRRYGKNAVKMEREYVDLTLVEPGQITYIEIKMEQRVKKCIRLALGQLLEYAHYPNCDKVDRLLVVGDVQAREDDEAYLRYIREKYGIPLYYSQWSWVNEDLGSAI